MEPRSVGPFLLEKELGRGGMGIVYRARCLPNNRVVALKLLPPDREFDVIQLARFERELDVLKNLRHPHIVHCFGGVCDNHQRFYAMELVEHGTLADLIRQRGSLRWDETVEYGLQIVSALGYLHERGIVHRDVKPANLLMSRQGCLKLSDFGVALLTSGHHLTREGRTVGSYCYMAPEQISGKGTLSGRTDLYALGCVLFEMLTGRRPFGDSAGPTVLLDHLRKLPPNVQEFAPECPRELADLIAQLLEKNSDRRPNDAAAVIQTLQQMGTTPRALIGAHISLDDTWDDLEENESFDDIAPESTALPNLWANWRPNFWPTHWPKWCHAACLIVIGIVVGFGLRSHPADSRNAPTTVEQNAAADAAGSHTHRSRLAPETESRAPSIILGILTVAILAALVIRLRNTVDETHPPEPPDNSRRENLIRANRAAREYLKTLSGISASPH